MNVYSNLYKKMQNVVSCLFSILYAYKFKPLLYIYILNILIHSYLYI